MWRTSEAEVSARQIMAQPGNGFECVACILCGSQQAESVVAAPDRYLGMIPDMWFQVVRCRGCGLHFQNPRPTAERLGDLYPQHYYAYQPSHESQLHGVKAAWRRLEWWEKLGLRRAFCGYPCPGGWIQRVALQLILWPLWIRLRFLGKDLKVIPYRGRGRLLDVGCGTGRELAYHRQCGLTVAGVEWSASAAQEARERYDLDVRAGMLEDARFPDQSFDVVHLSHVFEHVPNPAATLDEIHRLLDVDGLVILKVPNMASMSAKRFGTYWLGLDLPRHLYHFTPRTITQLLDQHGFMVEAIRHDVGSWWAWRESRRSALRETRGKESADQWWQDQLDRLLEAAACLRQQGSVIAVCARKESR